MGVPRVRPRTRRCIRARAYLPSGQTRIVLPSIFAVVERLALRPSASPAVGNVSPISNRASLANSAPSPNSIRPAEIEYNQICSMATALGNVYAGVVEYDIVRPR